MLALRKELVHAPLYMDFSDGSVVRESAYQCRRHRRFQFNPWVGKIPLEEEMATPLVFLSGEFHGQRSMAGYSP